MSLGVTSGPLSMGEWFGDGGRLSDVRSGIPRVVIMPVSSATGGHQLHGAYRCRYNIVGIFCASRRKHDQGNGCEKFDRLHFMYP